jgi:hypothetical protein
MADTQPPNSSQTAAARRAASGGALAGVDRAREPTRQIRIPLTQMHRKTRRTRRRSPHWVWCGRTAWPRCTDARQIPATPQIFELGLQLVRNREPREHPPPPDHGFTPGQHARTPIDGSEGRRDSSAARTNSTAMVAHRGRGLGLPGAEVSEVGFIPRFHPHLQQIEPNFMRGARSSRWIRNVEEKALTKWARATVRQRRGVWPRHSCQAGPACKPHWEARVEMGCARARKT